MMLIFEYQPKSKVLKMLSDSVLEISIFKIFLGVMPPDPPSIACFADYSGSTITIIYPEMQCALHYVLQPHIYYVLQYTLKLAPPPENPRSAPGL